MPLQTYQHEIETNLKAICQTLYDHPRLKTDPFLKCKITEDIFITSNNKGGIEIVGSQDQKKAVLNFTKKFMIFTTKPDSTTFDKYIKKDKVDHMLQIKYESDINKPTILKIHDFMDSASLVFSR